MASLLEILKTAWQAKNAAAWYGAWLFKQATKWASGVLSWATDIISGNTDTKDATDLINVANTAWSKISEWVKDTWAAIFGWVKRAGESLQKTWESLTALSEWVGGGLADIVKWKRTWWEVGSDLAKKTWDVALSWAETVTRSGMSLLGNIPVGAATQLAMNTALNVTGTKEWFNKATQAFSDIFVTWARELWFKEPERVGQLISDAAQFLLTKWGQWARTKLLGNTTTSPSLLRSVTGETANVAWSAAPAIIGYLSEQLWEENTKKLANVAEKLVLKDPALALVLVASGADLPWVKWMKNVKAPEGETPTAKVAEWASVVEPLKPEPVTKDKVLDQINKANERKDLATENEIEQAKQDARLWAASEVKTTKLSKEDMSGYMDFMKTNPWKSITDYLASKSWAPKIEAATPAPVKPVEAAAPVAKEDTYYKEKGIEPTMQKIVQETKTARTKKNLTDKAAAKTPTRTLTPSEITTRIAEGGNVIEGKEFAYNPAKLEWAKKDIEAGKNKPVKLETMPDGNVSITDWFHRVQAAKDAWIDIPATIDGKPAILKGSEQTTTEVTKEAVPDLNFETGKPLTEIVQEKKTRKSKVKTEEAPVIESVGPVSTAYNNEMNRINIGEPKFGLKAGAEALKYATTDKLRSVGAFLNNVNVRLPNGRTTSLTNAATDIRDAGARMRSDIESDLWIVSKVNSLPKVDTKAIGDDAFIGARTPGGVEITPENVATYKKNTVDDIASIGLKWEIGRTKNLNDVWVLGHIWRINQDRPEIIDKYIPKEYQALFEEMKNSPVYAESAQILNKEWMLDTPAENYEHFILTKNALNSIGKDVKVTIDGQVLGFDNPQDAIRAVKAAERSWRSVDRAGMESILKEKWDVDFYRTYSPVHQIMHYIDHVTQLVWDTKMVDLLQKARKSDDPRVSKFLSDTSDGKWWIEDPVRNLLGIDAKPEWVIEKIAQPVGRLVWAAQLAWNLASAAQSFTSAQGRKYLLWLIPGAGAKTKILPYKNVTPEVRDTMRAEWIIQNYGLWDSKWLMWKAIELSTTLWENNAKQFIGLWMLSKFLDSKNVVHDANDATSIVNAWKDYTKPTAELTPEQSQIKNAEIMALKWDISDNIKTISDVSSQAKFGVKPLNRLWFGKFKSFMNWYLEWIKKDSQTIWDALVSRFSSKFGGGSSWADAAKATSRLALQVWTAVALVKAIEASLSSDDDTKEERDLNAKLAQSIVAQWYGDPETIIKGYIPSLVGNPVLNTVYNLWTWVANAAATWIKTASKDLWEAAAQVANELGRTLLKNVAAGRTANTWVGIITGKSLEEIMSNALGIVNKENMTSTLKDTGKDTNSRWEFAARTFGYKLDDTTRDWLYSELDKNKQLQDSWARPNAFVSALKRIASDTVRNVTWLVPGQDKLEDVANYADNAVKQNYVIDAIKWAEDAKSFGDMLVRLSLDGIADSRTLDKVVTGIRNENDNMEKAINDYLVPIGVPNDLPFWEKVKWLSENNPVAYNNFIWGLAKAMMYFDQNKWTGTEFNEMQADKFSKFFTSDPVIDSAIASYKWTDPNTTDITNAMVYELKNLEDAVVNKDPALNEKLQAIENMNKAVLAVSQYSDWYENALALAQMDYQPLIEKIKQAGLDIRTIMPVTTDLIDKALYIRWERRPVQVTNVPTTGESPIPNWETVWTKKPSLLDMTAYAPKKLKANEVASIKAPAQRITKLFDPTTLPWQWTLLQMAQNFRRR